MFLIDETYRYTRDSELLSRTVAAVRKAVAYMDKLRLSERTEENQQGDRAAFYGLMPASISHEGYSAKPMHSYWDNFWALAGYEAAVRIARTLGRERGRCTRFIESRDQFRSDLYRSLAVAMQHARHRLSARRRRTGRFRSDLDDDRADARRRAADVAAAELSAPSSATGRISEAPHGSTDWDDYTPYEWRNLGAFVRLGWRERGAELIEFFMADRRPAAWNQWAEVVGREAAQAALHRRHAARLGRVRLRAIVPRHVRVTSGRPMKRWC